MCSFLYSPIDVPRGYEPQRGARGTGLGFDVVPPQHLHLNTVYRIPRRARIQGSSIFVSLNSRLESSEEEEEVCSPSFQCSWPEGSRNRTHHGFFVTSTKLG